MKDRLVSTMYQIAFEIFGKPIHWYGICIAVGFLAATGIMLWKKEYAEMTSDAVFDCAMYALISGLVGARIFYVVQFWQQDFAGKSFWKVFRVDQGGLVFYGGFILAILVVMLYARLKKFSILKILDLVSPAIAIGHTFGRIGCFMQGCCFGKPAGSSFCGVHYPLASAPARRYPSLNPLEGSSALYPVQLFESLANLLLCIFLLYLFKKVKRPGCIAGIYLMFYAAIRFVMEFFRGDHTHKILEMTPSQFIALCVMLPVGAAVFAWGWISYTKKQGEIHEQIGE